jgi:hypothetical protein
VSGVRLEDNIKVDLKKYRIGVWIVLILAQNRNMWWAAVKTLRKLWVPQNAGNFMTEVLLDRQEELSTMKLDNFISVRNIQFANFSQNTF